MAADFATLRLEVRARPRNPGVGPETRFLLKTGFLLTPIGAALPIWRVFC